MFATRLGISINHIEKEEVGFSTSNAAPYIPLVRELEFEFKKQLLPKEITDKNPFAVLGPRPTVGNIADYFTETSVNGVQKETN